MGECVEPVADCGLGLVHVEMGLCLIGNRTGCTQSKNVSLFRKCRSQSGLKLDQVHSLTLAATEIWISDKSEGGPVSNVIGIRQDIARWC